MTLGPLFALALGGLDALHVSGTFRAVLGPVGARAEQCSADGTTLGVQPIKQGCFQFFVQRQYRRPKPAAQQRILKSLPSLPLKRDMCGCWGMETKPAVGTAYWKCRSTEDNENKDVSPPKAVDSTYFFTHKRHTISVAVQIRHRMLNDGALPLTK